MIALLKNRFYCIEDSLKLTFASTLFFVVLLLCTKWKGTIEIIQAVMVLSAYSFTPLSVSMKQKDASSQWEKFSLTMPITRKNVVDAEFIAQWSITALALFCIMLSILLLNVGGVEIGFFMSVRVFSMCFTTLVVSQSILYVVGLQFGYGSMDLLYIISAAAAMGVFGLPALILNLLFPDSIISDTEYQIGVSVLACVICGISYLYCKMIIEKKEF